MASHLLSLSSMEATPRTLASAAAAESTVARLGRLLTALARAAAPWERALVSASLSLIARLGEWMPRPSGEVSSESAYYVNAAVPAVARISAGVRLPAGRWVRLAGQETSALEAQKIARLLFPALSDATLYVFALHTNGDVDDFERCFGAAASPRPFEDRGSP